MDVMLTECPPSTAFLVIFLSDYLVVSTFTFFLATYLLLFTLYVHTISVLSFLITLLLFFHNPFFSLHHFIFCPFLTILYFFTNIFLFQVIYFFLFLHSPHLTPTTCSEITKRTMEVHVKGKRLKE